MKNHKREELKSICDKYKRNYTNIFRYLYPSKNSTGFTEKNQTVNFCKALEEYYTSKSDECFSWYEFQFGSKNNLHLDAIFLNVTQKEIFFIEAKRYSNIGKKIIEVGKDIKRLLNLGWVEDEYNDRINLNGYNFFGVILSDIWREGDKKEKIIAQWRNAERDFKFYSCYKNQDEMNLEDQEDNFIIDFNYKVKMSVAEYIDSEFNTRISFEDNNVYADTIRYNYNIFVSVFEIPL